MASLWGSVSALPSADSLAIGIGLGLALGAAFDALKGKIGK